MSLAKLLGAALPCSAGRYGAAASLASDNECIACPAGYYCGGCDVFTQCSYYTVKAIHGLVNFVIFGILANALR